MTTNIRQETISLPCTNPGYFPPLTLLAPTIQQASHINETFKQHQTLYQIEYNTDRVIKKQLQMDVEPPHLKTLRNDLIRFIGVMEHMMIKNIHHK